MWSEGGLDGFPILAYGCFGGRGADVSTSQFKVNTMGCRAVVQNVPFTRIPLTAATVPVGTVGETAEGGL